MQPRQARKVNVRILLAVAGVIALGAVIWAGLGVQHYVGMANNGTVNLTLVPADTQALIDNDTTVTGDTLSLTPGTHAITFSRNGFASKTITITISAKETMSQTVILPATDATGQAYLNAHPDQVAVSEGVTGAQANTQGQKITANNPLISLLPYQGADFQIDFGVSQKFPNDPNAVAVYVTADTDAGRTHAVNWIKAQGYNPSVYEIIYQTSTGQ